MKRIRKVTILILAFICFLFFNSITTQTATDLPIATVKADDIGIGIEKNETEEPVNQIVTVETFNKPQDLIDREQNLKSIRNTYEWFIEWKNIRESYPDYYQEYENIYDYYTEEEIYLMCRVIETETYTQPFECKVNVANVIFNRLSHEDFDNTVERVVTKPSQFAYWRTVISEDTKLALEYAFIFPDTTGGAIAFHSFDTYKETFFGYTRYFEDSCGHTFYGD